MHNLGGSRSEDPSDDRTGRETEQKNTNNKIITDYRFLINRTITHDILALNGELIAKQNSKVTKEIINKASLYGKLMEVARYSKKELT